MGAQILKMLDRRQTLDTTQAALRQMVDDPAEAPGIALARIWLVQPGDICGSCGMRAQCRSQERCLHLMASAGRSLDPEKPETWDRLNGDFRRFPMDSQKIGRIGATGEPLLVHHVPGCQARTRMSTTTVLKC